MTKQEIAFSSFFMGEGMLRISDDKRKSGNRYGKNYGKTLKPWYRQVVRITLRNDDSAIVDWILKEIGGHCFFRAKRDKVYNKKTGAYSFSNPIIIWQAEDLKTCGRVAKLLMKNPIPSKKKKEAKYFLDYVKLKMDNYSKGKSYPKGILEKFEFYHKKLRELKKYKEC
jgi:hypothetical protein